MGYRSDGKIWLDEEAQKLMPEDVKEFIDNEWTEEGDGVWSFYDWKWYGGSIAGYPEVKAVEDFLRLLHNKDMEEHFDFARFGEEYEDTEIETGMRFSINRTIEVWA